MRTSSRLSASAAVKFWGTGADMATFYSVSRIRKVYEVVLSVRKQSVLAVEVEVFFPLVELFARLRDGIWRGKKGGSLLTPPWSQLSHGLDDATIRKLPAVARTSLHARNTRSSVASAGRRAL
jgi:hypothetical protein